ncbi:MAG: hexose kinase [Rhodobacteraceae bacterium]|nr:hexose kinase [Paracoccaceae bacterium]
MSAQTPILTATLNPALDLSARVDRMLAGPKLRMTDPLTEPGGGGVNVARAIHELGGAVTAWVALSGSTGAQHGALLRGQGVDVHAFTAPGETRSSWAVTDAQGAQYRLQLPGPEWSAQAEQAALEDIAAQAAALVVLSGSQPPGIAADFPQVLARKLGAGRLIVDISGDALRQTLDQPDAQARPYLLRMDQAESEAQAGHALPGIVAAADFAAALVARGVAEHVCIAQGANGSVLAGPDGLALHCRPPKVAVKSKVGAGDSFTGAFTLALAQGQDMAVALQWGTAAAAAAVVTEGTALCRREDFARLVPQCRVTPLHA